MPIDLAQLDATAQAELVRRGDVSPTELVEAALARIARHDPELGALVHHMPDQARAAAVDPPAGPFRGVPIVIKDLGPFIAGEPHSGGMKFLRRRGFRPPMDTYVVQKLKAAGFVIVGTTKCPEMGILPTSEPVEFGPARNPYDLTRSSGGSSGGTASAVAAGLVPLGHGNDGGGSIRIPASACGLVGLKVTRGRISQGPFIGELLGGLPVEGGLTRSVRDTAALLDVLCGAMPGDPNVPPPPTRPYLAEVGAAPGKLRVGYSTRALDASGKVKQAHPDCVAAVERTAALLASLGHAVEEAPITALEDPDYVPNFMTIWAVGVASGLGLWCKLFGARPREDDVEPLTWALYQQGMAIPAADYVAAWHWLHMNGRLVAAWFGARDLYLSPTMAEPPPPLGTFDVPPGQLAITALHRAAEACPFTPPFNATGQPAVSLPLHTNAAGLPIGIQLVAGYGREDLLLRVASQLEAAAPFLHPATRS